MLRLKIVLVLLVFFVILFFARVKFSHKNQKSYPPVIKIAWIGPLSGNAKILGEDNLISIEMVINSYKKNREMSHPQIEFKSYDDQYSAQKSKELYNQIRKDYKPHIVFLSTYEAVLELSDLFANDKVIVINPIDNDLRLSGLQDNIFLIAKRTEQLASIVSKAMIADHLQNASILYFNNDSFMPTVASNIRNQFNAKDRVPGLFPYKMENFNPEAILPAKVLEKTDGVVLLGYSEMETAIRYIRKSYPDIRLYSVNTALALANDPELIPLIEGMRIAHFTRLDGNIEKADLFLQSFEALKGRRPYVEWIAFQAFDAATILVRTIKDIISDPAGSHDRFSTILQNYLKRDIIHSGVSGDITINIDGTSDGIYMGSYTISNGNPVRNQ